MTKGFKAVLFVFLLSVMNGGCRNMAPHTDPHADSEPTPLGTRIAGEIERYNEEQGYIILKTVIPPPPGITADVLHGHTKTAQVVFTDATQYPYTAANVIQGTPRKGDLVIYDLPNDQ